MKAGTRDTSKAVLRANFESCEEKRSFIYFLWNTRNLFILNLNRPTPFNN
jgi:hypothetical protein